MIEQLTQIYTKNINALLLRPEVQIKCEQRGFDGELLLRYEGIPKGTRLINSGNEVYRHYSSQENLESIRRENLLKSGRVPYARISPGCKCYWDNLRGIFITRPEFKAADVGVPASKYYIDFKLVENLPLVQIENKILLIPELEGLPLEVAINIL